MERSYLPRQLCFRLYKQLYYLGGLLAVLNKKGERQRYEISIDGENLDGTYMNLNIANGPCYGDNMYPVSTAVPDDGMLDVLLTKSLGNFKILRHFFPYLKGKFYKYPSEFTLKRGRTITIRSESPLLINFDDDIFFDTDITVELVPHAVKIVAAVDLSSARRSVARA
jgi:diacylglycerol kinase family enzyme